MDKLDLETVDREHLNGSIEGMFITQVIDKLNEIIDWINTQ